MGSEKVKDALDALSVAYVGMNREERHSLVDSVYGWAVDKRSVEVPSGTSTSTHDLGYAKEEEG